jgi:hypothetical protein
VLSETSTLDGALEGPVLTDFEAQRDAAPGSVRERLSATGFLLAISCAAVGASVFPQLRPRIGSMLMHPVHFGCVPLLVFGIGRIRLIRGRILVAIFACAIFFSISALTAKGGIAPTLKMVASVASILGAATAIKSERDFRWAAIGFALGACVASVRGLIVGTYFGIGGINPMVGIANKNAFSLYILPAILLGGHIALHAATSRLQRLVLAGCILTTVFTIFSTANRSGWLCVGLIVLILAYKAIRRFRQFVLLAILVGTAVYLPSRYGNTEMIEHRIEQTREGYGSDRLRIELITHALEVAAQHPIFGASPQRLPYEVARRSPIRGVLTDLHNVFALIIGGGGALLSLAFMGLFIALWQRPRGWFRELKSTPLGEAHDLLRAMVLLWCVRGFFSAEILYTPAFSLGIGICIGLVIVREASTAEEFEEQTE